MPIAMRQRLRHIEGGVGREEADRLQQEAGVGDRHHRPVLRARRVVAAQCVPEDDVRLRDRAVGSGPVRESRAPRMLRREIARLCANRRASFEALS